MSARNDQSDHGFGPAPAAEERRNLELKARLDSLDVARQVARRLATEPRRTQIQTDVYFHCRHGRLKLRHIEGDTAQLVSYSRPDQREVSLSRYRLAEVPDAVAVEQALADALGVWLTVRKCREIYMYFNVRIHLDQVDGLGAFLEFEAVLGPTADEPTSQQRLDFLIQQFNIRPNALIDQSYSDMLAARRHT
jgi:predicted adenylyl cyclase CyaB